jgi:hyaluronate lyase
MPRFLLVFVFLLFSASTRADEFDDLRLKWRDFTIGTGYDVADANVAARLASIANSANNNWSSMDKSPGRTFLWSDLASTTISIHINYSYQRLRSMALAYSTPGCSLYGNPTLLADTIGGLDWMHANRYNPTVSIYDNWYEFEIGSPIQLVDIAVLLYDQLSPAQISNYMGAVEKFTPSATTQAPGGTSGSFTGSNRMLKIRIVAVRGCVVKDPVKIAAARDALSNLFVYVTSGDGFYTDGSFIQHTDHPYTAAYGSGLLASIAPVLNWLSGSTWTVTDPLQSNVFSWVYDSFEPIIYKGAALDLVRGREAGRAGDPQGVGHTIMDSIMQIAQFAPPADSLRMKRMVKEWALSDTVRDFVGGRPLSTITYAENLIADPGVVRRGELINHYTFPEMDRVVHLQKGFCFGLSMCSTRIANFESINGNNLRGWFTGDGMTTLYNADLNQFGDDTNCTIDAYRMPGVTADVTHVKLPNVPASVGPRAQGESTRSPHSWVGGAKLGSYGAAGMQFKGVGVTLTGKKSWFMFDDEIVCLGAGITSTDTRPIETTVENRKINGGNVLTVNGTAKPTTLGWSETMALTTWAHLQGNVSGSDIGYYFPTAPAIRAVREARSASPSEIDVGASTALQTRNFLRLGFEHGNNPTNSTYQYVLLPGRSAARTGHYAAAPDITILTNNANVQAVRENTLGITAINFWTDTVQTYGGITSNKKASVLVRDDGTFIDVSVSDPTQLNTGNITLQIALDGGTLVSADSGVSVTQTSPTIALNVATAGAAGKTFTARFYNLVPETVELGPVADSYVEDAAGKLDTNYGNGGTIVVKKAPAGFNRESYLRFNVPASGGTLLGATLRLSALTTTSPGVHGISLVSDDSWTEGGITWNNKPASGDVLTTWTPAAGTVSSVNVTSAMPVSGNVSLRIAALTETSNGFVSYASRNNTTVANRPVLSLTYGNTPPEITLTAPNDGYTANPGPVLLAADAVATDGAITAVAFYDGETLLGTDTSAPFTLTSPLGGGPHFIRAVATDANGLSRSSLVARIDLAYPPGAAAASISTQPGVPVDIDLRALVSDVETPSSSLKLTLGASSNGTVTLLADKRTARFTPAAGFSGAASFSYTVTDTTRDARTLVNYNFQSSDASDASGQGRAGTLNVQGTGAATFASGSPLADFDKNLSLTENGSAGAARLERLFVSSEIDLNNADWTITGWFRRNPSTNMDVIVHLGNSGGFGNVGSSSLVLAFYANANSNLQLRHWNSSNVEDVSISRTNVASSTWHHFAIVRTGGTLALYLNGVLVGSDSAFAFAFDAASPVKFGGANSATVLDRWLNGSLSDLALFNAPLSLAEINTLRTLPVQWLGGLSSGATVNVTVLTPVETWRQSNFGTTANTGQSADSADFDGDGLTNLLEYAFATDPKVSTSAPHSVALTVGTLDFVYPKNKTATDVTYSVEWSDTLGNDWSTAGVGAPVVLGDNGTTQQIKVSVPYTEGVTRRFIRLKVTRP